MKVNELKFKIADDIKFIIESENENLENISKKTGVSKNSLYEALENNIASIETCEKIYSYAYDKSYRLNSVKEEIIKETNDLVLFHGSKHGLTNIDYKGSRSNCDFGEGFYLGETYENALNFVYEFSDTSVYSFSLSLEGLNVLQFKCDLEWMLAICYFRGQLKNYENSKIIKSIVEKINNADLIIAPIADNRMFYIMSLFTTGDINVDVAIHSLSASNLGMQYVIKTKKSLNNLTPIERYYISGPEKRDCYFRMEDRVKEIETKLKLSKREFRNGLYIDEVLQ